MMEFNDLKTQYKKIKYKLKKDLNYIFSKSQYIGGKYVNKVEEKLAKYVGRKYCITCANGTDALQLSLMALNIGEGDAFFCPNVTFIASAEAGLLLGAKAFLIDIDKNSYNIDTVKLEEEIKRVIKEKKYSPKAIVVVDFLGNPADYEEIKRIAKKYELHIIEDAAQSMGAKYKNNKCGSFGIISTTSFYPSKPLGCYGDGGALFTDDDSINIKLRSLRSHGKGKNKYDNIYVGVNSRLDNIQAAVILQKLKLLDNEIIKRQKIARIYNNNLSAIVTTPKILNYNTSAYAQYVILLKNKKTRDMLKEKLMEKNIPTLIYYPKTLSDMPALNYPKRISFEHSHKYVETNLGLPFSPYLKRRDQIKIVKLIRDFLIKEVN
jgi:UDP-2-acetamido-2-deoxy-ribo-hexuluronate aminotransferase